MGVEDNNTNKQNNELYIGTGGIKCSRNKSWTCDCLYKCRDCERLEKSGEDKHDFFEKKGLDYWEDYW